MVLRSSNAPSPKPLPQPLLVLRSATKDVSEGGGSYPAFRNLSLSVYPGERLGIFSVNGTEAKTLVDCLSGVEPLDRGTLEQNATVSWPLGSNDAFSNKLSGYLNARFAVEVYGRPAVLKEQLALIQELSGVPDDLFYNPMSNWPSHAKDALKLAVSLAFEFDVVMVGRVNIWDHLSVHPRAAKIRRVFEDRIAGRTMVMCGNGQSPLALDFCDEGLALVDGSLAYRGDPEVCLELVREESKKQKRKRRARVNARVARMVEDDDQPQAVNEPLTTEVLI
jgi:ABC-type polysaccharide/polyol phosphate transport system ATPase subunit